MQENEVKKSKDFKNNWLAIISFSVGIISIGTDLLFMFGFYEMLEISVILEWTAIITGVLALVLKQNKNWATQGILMGLIGVAWQFLFLF